MLTRCKEKAVLIQVFLLLFVFSFEKSAVPSSGEMDKRQEDSFYVAAKAYEDGFYDVSLKLFEKFLKSYMESEQKLEAMVYVGQCYFTQEKYLKALDQFESVLRMKGVERIKDRVFFWLGEVYAKGKDYRQAQKFFQQLIELFPNSYYAAPGRLSLAKVLIADSKYAQAHDVFIEALSSAPEGKNQSEIMIGALECLYRLGDYKALRIEAEDDIARGPDAASLTQMLFYLAESCFYLGEYADAVASYEKVYEFSPEGDQKTQALLGKGWAYLKLKDFNKAQEVFAVFPDKDKSLGVKLGGAVLLSGLGEFEKALPLYEEIISLDSGADYAPLAYFGRAEALYHLTRYEEAIVSYRTAMDKLKVVSGHFVETRELKDRIRYGLAWSYVKVGDFRSAQDEFQKIATHSQDKIFKLSALCQLGDAYQDAGEFQKAIATYGDFLNRYPESIYSDYVQYQLGMAWLKMGKMESAVLVFRQLLKEFPDSKMADDVAYSLGLAYFQGGRFESASSELSAFRRSFEGSPYRPQSLFLLGESLMNLGEYREAIQVFGQVIKDYPQQDTLRQRAEYETAQAYLLFGQESEGERRLADFITRYPDSTLAPDVIFWLGESFLTKKDFQMARKYFERLIRNYPDYELAPEAFLKIGQIAIQEGDWEMARRSFKEAQDKGQGAIVSKAFLSSGDLALSQGDLTLARQEFGKVAFARGQLSRTGFLRLAEVEMKERNMDKAQRYLEDALAVNGTEMDAMIELKIAGLYEEMGNFEKALEAYLRIVYLREGEKEWYLKALLSVARIYEKKEEWANLRKILLKIVELSVPETEYARGRLAELQDSGLVRTP